MGELDFYYVDERSPRARRRLMRFYKECVRRQLYLNGPAGSHLSKNPTFSGRVESLIETFPDARIVVLMRDPRETIPSLLKLLQTDVARRGLGRRGDRAVAARPRRSVVPHLPLPARGARPAPGRRARDRRLPRPRRVAEARDRRRLRRARSRDDRRRSSECWTRGAAATAHERTHTLQPRRVRPARRRDPDAAGRSVRALRVAAAGRGRRSDVDDGDEDEHDGDGAARRVGRPDRARSGARATRSRTRSCYAPPAGSTGCSPRATATCSGSSTARSSAPHDRSARSRTSGARSSRSTRRRSTTPTRSTSTRRSTADETYVIRGRAADYRHWRGRAAASSGRKAPQYVIVEAASGYAGDTGSSPSCVSGPRAGTGSARLVRPRGRAGRDVRDPARARASGRAHRQLHPDDHRMRGDERSVIAALAVSPARALPRLGARGRARLEIVRVGAEDEHPPPLDPRAPSPSGCGASAEIVGNQMLFWNEFYAVCSRPTATRTATASGSCR